MLQALASYESAVGNLKGLIGDLLRISRDRDAYWQYRLDREANVRRMWEESMAKVAKDQEELENRFGESEIKRRKQKRALREVLEEYEADDHKPPRGLEDEFVEASEEPQPASADQSGSSSQALRRKATLANLAADMSEDESDEDDEFFDAVGAGEVEVVQMPDTSPRVSTTDAPLEDANIYEIKHTQIATAFIGYEDGPRTKFNMDEDNRPKVSLWVTLTPPGFCLHGPVNNNMAGDPQIYDRQGHDQDDIASVFQRTHLVTPACGRGYGIHRPHRYCRRTC